MLDLRGRDAPNRKFDWLNAVLRRKAFGGGGSLRNLLAGAGL
jgi:hypothetical protein